MIQYFILAGFALSVLLWIYGIHRAIKKHDLVTMWVSVALIWMFNLLLKIVWL